MAKFDMWGAITSLVIVIIALIVYDRLIKARV